MSYSRVDKLVRELRKEPSLATASAARNLPVTILVGADTTNKAAVMAYTAVSLAIRCFGGDIRVVLGMPEPAGLPWMPGSLREQLLAEASRCGARRRLLFPSDIPESGPVIALGIESDLGYMADAAGWTAGVGRIFGEKGPAVAPAAVLATCCSFAKLFREIVLGVPSIGNEAWALSLLDFSVEPQVTPKDSISNLDLGRLALVGAGAIGSGFALTLWLSGWSCKGTVIDKDRYEEPNFETTMLIGRQDALEAKPKADSLTSVLNARQGLDFEPLTTFVSAASPVLKMGHDVLVCAVDNPETRRRLDGHNARLLVNGGVGGTRLDSGHILWSRHGALDLPLSALYPEREDENQASVDDMPPPAEVNDQCSRVAYGGVSMAAPFIGLASGALLLASCAHRALGISPEVNYLKIDLFGVQGKVRRELRTRRS